MTLTPFMSKTGLRKECTTCNKKTHPVTFFSASPPENAIEPFHSTETQLQVIRRESVPPWANPILIL